MLEVLNPWIGLFTNLYICVCVCVCVCVCMCVCEFVAIIYLNFVSTSFFLIFPLISCC